MLARLSVACQPVARLGEAFRPCTRVPQPVSIAVTAEIRTFEHDEGLVTARNELIRARLTLFLRASIGECCLKNGRGERQQKSSAQKTSILQGARDADNNNM